MSDAAFTPAPIARLTGALPFWLSVLLVPLAILGASLGGWAVLLIPLCTWYLFSLVDALTGLDQSNPDPQTPDAHLFWYRLVTLIWWPVQFGLTFALIYYATRAGHLGGWEKIGLFFGIGVINGTIGITYAHELMHQKNRVERWMGDLLMAMVMYSHFRSEHLLIHHRYVATPRDPVTARYNEGFHRFFPRVLRQCLVSAWRAEAAMQARRGHTAWHRSNPFWRYAALQVGVLLLAFALGGWEGIGLLLFSAFVAVWQLELVNYVEHYGLTRKHLGDGKYEHVKPCHSWNASHRATNWLLINLQRHSDHHYKPDRRFPLLQTYDSDEAPQLPHGYPLMTMAAMVPPLWRRVMNPRVRAWRRRYYPEITDWTPYRRATNSAAALRGHAFWPPSAARALPSKPRAGIVFASNRPGSGSGVGGMRDAGAYRVIRSRNRCRDGRDCASLIRGGRALGEGLDGRKELTAAEIGALAHLYRGEVYRSTIWRTRLDTTTNWSVVTLGIALSISFSSPAASPLPLLLVGILVFFFLMLEARRYRYFNVWRARCRWMEKHFFAPMLQDGDIHLEDGWQKQLADDYWYPRYHVTMWVAMGRRIRRNYFWILLIQTVAYAGKLAVHPEPLASLTQIPDRAAIGPFPGALVLAFGAVYCLSLGVIAFWSWRDDKQRAAHRQDNGGMG